ncbi:MAG: type II secretion system protein [Planctomycetes bacterium]|nr:type II secretion system protein [Planctomycetota bacterium]MCP4770942.1 type II secretion system protein [Planctomycetota bacterium]MCP4861662.1 type II secretion system protein [Planctomycetota bacterium]
MKRTSQSGFTIIEMLIVVTILAMLAGILLPVLEDAALSSRDARRSSDLKSMQAALESYKRVNGTYPDTGGAFQGDAPTYGGLLYDAAGYCPGLVPDYLPALPKDPSPDIPNATTGGYMYSSDGVDFKFVCNEGPETFPAGNPFYDPTRAATAWQISSPGGYNW